MKWTVDKIMQYEPCYSREQIEEMAAGRDSMTTEEILRRDDMQCEDRVWVATLPGALPDEVLRRFVALTIDRAVRKCNLEYPDDVALTVALAAESTADAAAAAAAERSEETTERRQQVADILRLIEECKNENL